MIDIENLIKDWGELILSSMGIIGNIYVYLKHNKRLNEQESRLNELQIKQFEKEEDKEKMAEMRCYAIHVDKGSTKIRFINAGKSDALNVRIKILTPEEQVRLISCNAKWGPYEVINPESYRDEPLMFLLGAPKTIDIQIIWNDKYQDDRNVVLSVPLQK